MKSSLANNTSQDTGAYGFVAFVTEKSTVHFLHRVWAECRVFYGFLLLPTLLSTLWTIDSKCAIPEFCTSKEYCK
jgi:hypothetical protein